MSRRGIDANCGVTQAAMASRRSPVEISNLRQSNRTLQKEGKRETRQVAWEMVGNGRVHNSFCLCFYFGQCLRLFCFRLDTKAGLVYGVTGPHGDKCDYQPQNRNKKKITESTQINSYHSIQSIIPTRLPRTPAPAKKPSRGLSVQHLDTRRVRHPIAYRFGFANATTMASSRKHGHPDETQPCPRKPRRSRRPAFAWACGQ